MAINNNFYLAINSLVNQGTDGTQAIVDYESFMDYGKQITDLSISNDLQNAYMSNFLNRIKMVINDNPMYTGQYQDIVVSGGDPGEIVQTVLTTFYEATYNRALTELENGQSYTDQFEVNKIKGKTLYHTDTNGKEFALTIEDVRWRAAWSTPQQLDEFNRANVNGILNSIALAGETERMAMVADVIKTCLAQPASDTDETVGAMRFKTITLYNYLNDTELTAANAFANDDFVRWTVGLIGDMSDMMSKVSTKFNKHGSDVGDEWKTFTPKEYQRLKINSLYEKAIRRSQVDAFHTENWKLPDVSTEKVPYWQNEDLRMQVELGPSTEEDETPTYSVPVFAVMFDKRRIMQQIQMDDVQSERNNRRRYTNYFWQTAFMAYACEYANSIVFALE